jgi:hypothetical protein
MLLTGILHGFIYVKLTLKKGKEVLKMTFKYEKQSF